MIQEMEDTLVEIRSAAAKCIADRKEQRRYAEFLEREQKGWAKRAELAVRQSMKPKCSTSSWKNSIQTSPSYKAS